MFDHGATQDEVFMARAKYVPAISSAVGHTNVVEDLVDNSNLNSPSCHCAWGRNIPLNGLFWYHSDMKDMAYFYVWPLYQQLVNEKGRLK